jgi:hypothetical protein
MLARDKRSSLFCPFFSDEDKTFYASDTRGLYFKALRICNENIQ